MSAFINSLASSLLASSIMILEVIPVLAQYSCPSREIQSLHEVGDLKFELQGCQRSGKKVTCSAWITNTDKDIQGYVAGTRLVDTSGEQYKFLPTKDSGYIMLSFAKDVPMKISASYMDVPTSVQDIALFEIETASGGFIKKGQFRNLKITQLKMGNPPSSVKKKK